MDKPDLLIIGLDRLAVDLAMAASALGAQVLVATRGKSGLDQALQDGEALSRLASSPPGADVESRRQALVEDLRRARSVERLRAARVQVSTDPVQFQDRKHVALGERIVTPRRIILATGRRGTGDADRVSEALRTGEWPDRLVLRGGGLALDAALVGARAGSRVTLVPAFAPGEIPDGETLAHYLAALAAAGITVQPELPNLRPADLPIWDLGPAVADIEGLAVEAAGLMTRDGALPFGAHLEAGSIFVLGSLTTRHHGEATDPGQVGYLLARLLFRKPGRYRPAPVLRHFGGSPGWIGIGITENLSGKKPGAFQISRSSANEALGPQQAIVKLIADRQGRLLGAAATGDAAADLAPVLSLALKQELRLDQLAALALPPGSTGEALRLAAAAPQRATLRSPRLHRLLRLLRILG